MFENCQTPEEDRVLIRNFERPSQVYADCYTRNIFKLLDLTNADNTVNTVKLGKQFTDYGKPLPSDLETIGGINIDKETSALTDKLFLFMKNNKEDIFLTYYGNVNEKF